MGTNTSKIDKDGNPVSVLDNIHNSLGFNIGDAGSLIMFLALGALLLYFATRKQVDIAHHS
jgi:hypothetical protein